MSCGKSCEERISLHLFFDGLSCKIKRAQKGAQSVLFVFKFKFFHEFDECFYAFDGHCVVD